MHTAISSLIQLVFPARCLYCHSLVPQTNQMCGSCWNRLEFISDPLCQVCGMPFACDTGVHPVCGHCLMNPPPYRLARSAILYNDASRKLVAGFKYYDKTAYRHLLGRWIAYAGRTVLPDAQWIIPVPLHTRRLLARRYNQSALLAHALSQLSGIPAKLDMLVRTRHTPPQATLKRSQRLQNVKHAFTVNPNYTSLIHQQHVVLVDDVMTTGATIHACCLALRHAGAKYVDVLTIARAPL